MIHSRILTSICGLVLTAALALAQAPAPAVPPQPPAAPAPAAAPRPAPAPMAPFYMSAPDWFSDAVREKMALAQDKAQLALAQYARLSRTDSDDRLYQDGQRALDSRHWDQALEDFNQVAARAGSRADGAIYWKAYTLNKLGRRDEAMAAIAELRKSYASSRWSTMPKRSRSKSSRPPARKCRPKANRMRTSS